MVDKCLRVGVANSVGNESSDDFGESADNEADESVKDDLFGFLDFTGVARGNGIRDAAVNDKNGGDDAGHTDSPLDEIGDHLVGIYTTAARGAVADVAAAADESDADSAHDNVGGHDNSKANKGVSESLFAGGDFAGVARGRNIKIAAVDNITDDKIGGDDGDIGDDVSDNDPDLSFERFFVGNTDAAIPRSKTKEIAATGFGAIDGKSGLSGSETENTRDSREDGTDN